MSESEQRESEQTLEAPVKLVTALKETSRPQVFVPPYVDQVILKAARDHFSKPTRPRLGNFRRWMLWPAVATACVVLVWAARLLTTSSQSHYAQDDLNHDGRVDILDSFALARELKSGKPLPAAFDVNGDGVIDERDVALIAARAVKLEKRPES